MCVKAYRGFESHSLRHPLSGPLRDHPRKPAVARSAAGLTAAKVSKAGPGQYMDGNGLRLFVRGTGARFWIFRYTMAGRTREMGLGRAGAEPGAVPLSEARQKAGDLHRLVRSGTDPLAQRDAEQPPRRPPPNRRRSEGPRSGKPPNGLSLATRPAGATPSTAPNGAARLSHTPIPTWATCRLRTLRRSMSWPPCTRSGQPRPRRRRAYVAGSRRCWITPAPLDFGPGITPRGGGGICPTRCRHARRWRLAILADVARLRLSDAPDAFVFPSMSSAMRN